MTTFFIFLVGYIFGCISATGLLYLLWCAKQCTEWAESEPLLNPNPSSDDDTRS